MSNDTKNERLYKIIIKDNEEAKNLLPIEKRNKKDPVFLYKNLYDMISIENHNNYKDFPKTFCFFQKYEIKIVELSGYLDYADLKNFHNSEITSERAYFFYITYKDDIKKTSQLLRASDALIPNEKNSLKWNNYEIIIDKCGVMIKLHYNYENNEKNVIDILTLYLLGLIYNELNYSRLEQLKGCSNDFKSITGNNLDVNTIKTFVELKEKVLLQDIYYYFDNPVKIDRESYYAVWILFSQYLNIKKIQNEVKDKITKLSELLEEYYRKKEEQERENKEREYKVMKEREQKEREEQNEEIQKKITIITWIAGGAAIVSAFISVLMYIEISMTDIKNFFTNTEKNEKISAKQEAATQDIVKMTNNKKETITKSQKRKNSKNNSNK